MIHIPIWYIPRFYQKLLFYCVRLICPTWYLECKIGLSTSRKKPCIDSKIYDGKFINVPFWNYKSQKIKLNLIFKEIHKIIVHWYIYHGKLTDNDFMIWMHAFPWRLDQIENTFRNLASSLFFFIWPKISYFAVLSRRTPTIS